MSALAPFVTAAECGRPGDFTVTPIHGGFMVGETLPHLGSGPWWAYVLTIATLEGAVAYARVLARQAGSRAWFFDGNRAYRSIPLDDSPFSVGPLYARR